MLSWNIIRRHSRRCASKPITMAALTLKAKTLEDTHAGLMLEGAGRFLHPAVVCKTHMQPTNAYKCQHQCSSDLAALSSDPAASSLINLAARTQHRFGVVGSPCFAWWWLLPEQSWHSPALPIFLLICSMPFKELKCQLASLRALGIPWSSWARSSGFWSRKLLGTHTGDARRIWVTPRGDCIVHLACRKSAWAHIDARKSTYTRDSTRIRKMHWHWQLFKPCALIWCSLVTGNFIDSSQTCFFPFRTRFQ